MNRSAVRVFVEFHEEVNERARLGYVPGYRDRNSRVHIVLARDQESGRLLCETGQGVVPYEPSPLTAAALPCAACFDRALTQRFRQRRKAEEQPGRL